MDVNISVEQPANYRTQAGDRKSSLLYTFDGYAYVKDSKRNETLYLKCRHFKNKSCPGTAKIVGSNVTQAR